MSPRNPSSMAVVIPTGIIVSLLVIGTIALAISGHLGGSGTGSIVTLVMTTTTVNPCNGATESSRGFPLSGCGRRVSRRRRVKRRQGRFPVGNSLDEKNYLGLLKTIPKVIQDDGKAQAPTETADERSIHTTLQTKPVREFPADDKPVIQTPRVQDPPMLTGFIDTFQEERHYSTESGAEKEDTAERPPSGPEETYSSQEDREESDAGNLRIDLDDLRQRRATRGVKETTVMTGEWDLVATTEWDPLINKFQSVYNGKHQRTTQRPSLKRSDISLTWAFTTVGWLVTVSLLGLICCLRVWKRTTRMKGIMKKQDRDMQTVMEDQADLRVGQSGVRQEVAGVRQEVVTSRIKTIASNKNTVARILGRPDFSSLQRGATGSAEPLYMTPMGEGPVFATAQVNTLPRRGSFRGHAEVPRRAAMSPRFQQQGGAQGGYQMVQSNATPGRFQGQGYGQLPEQVYEESLATGMQNENAEFYQ